MKKSKPADIKEAVWLEEQCLRRQGGYNLDQSNLPASLKWLPKGTVLKLTSNGNAIAVKTARVTEKAEKSATTLKIASGSLFAIGDKIAGATISAITSESGIDTLTVSAPLENAVEAKAVVSDYDKTKDVLLGFSYDTLDLDKDASIPATPTLQVMEVEEDSLPFPINEEIKLGINAVGIALFKIQ